MNTKNNVLNTTKHQQQLEYQRLRHDIIYYIETYQRLYKRDDSYENIHKIKNTLFLSLSLMNV